MINFKGWVLGAYRYNSLYWGIQTHNSVKTYGPGYVYFLI